MPDWIDTHCHLDASEFDPDRQAVRAQARQLGVRHCVIPAVQAAGFEAVRRLAHSGHDAYALGLHPLYVADVQAQHLQQLDAALQAQADDPHLVAVGEIGLDFFTPALAQPPLRERQQDWFAQQLRLAQQHGLPVILHLRGAVDAVLQQLRRTRVSGGIAHAFNGSHQQAQTLLGLGFKLGFGGSLSFARAQHLRALATRLPLSALVLETDAPDMAPQWLYRTAAQRAAGQPQGRNDPAQLPAIAQVLADLRGIDVAELAAASSANACAALPRLAALLRSATRLSAA